MASITAIVNWFKTDFVPTQEHFYQAFTSFRHKDDKIPISDVDGIDAKLLDKAAKSALQSHISDESVHGATKAEQIPVILGDNKTIGQYKDGDTFSITEGMTLNQAVKKLLQEYEAAVFNLPVASLSATPGVSNSREVGETLEIDFTASLTQNDGGAASSYSIKKNGTEISDKATLTGETIVLSTTNVTYQATIGYAAGTGTKPNSLGEQEPNTIAAGNDDSNTLKYRGYRAVFYGPTATKKTTSAEIRTLAKRLENSGNTFTLNTGNTNKIFQLWLPNGLSLSSVVDLDALNANITSSYGSESLSVSDANGSEIEGTLYTFTSGVPYSSSHRHQITIN